MFGIDNSVLQIRKFGEVINAIRRDGWENVITGVGGPRDKAAYGEFRRSYRITDNDLRNMFHMHDLTKRIVQVRPREMFREGFQVRVPDDRKIEKGINKWVRTSGLISRFYEGKVWGRLFGGCLLIAGIDDGRDMSEPLEPDAEIKSVRYMMLLDKRYIWPATYYEDSENSKYMQVETYAVCLPTGQVLSARIHESRCVRFGGALTDDTERQMASGWDYSVIQHVYDVLKATENDFKSVNHLLSDASQAVFRIKGLLTSLVTPDGAANIKTRMDLVEMCRSVARAVVLDADANEDFKRETTSFAGIPDVLDRSMMRTSAAAEYPVALLFGRSAAGLNATGDGDYRHFYDGISSEQKTDVEPELRRVIDWHLRAKDGPTQGNIPEDYEIFFPRLWQPTPLEEAQIAKIYADRDAVRIQSQVWKPEEVAMSRIDGDDNGPVTIDVDLRKMMAENEKAIADHGPTDPVTGAPLGGPAEPITGATVRGDRDPGTAKPDKGGAKKDIGKSK